MGAETTQESRQCGKENQGEPRLGGSVHPTQTSDPHVISAKRVQLPFKNLVHLFVIRMSRNSYIDPTSYSATFFQRYHPCAHSWSLPSYSVQ